MMVLPTTMSGASSVKLENLCHLRRGAF